MTQPPNLILDGIRSLLLVGEGEYLDMYRGYNYATGEPRLYLVPNETYERELPNWDTRNLNTEESRIFLFSGYGYEHFSYDGNPFEELEERGYLEVSEREGKYTLAITDYASTNSRL